VNKKEIKAVLLQQFAKQTDNYVSVIINKVSLHTVHHNNCTVVIHQNNTNSCISRHEYPYI